MSDIEYTDTYLITPRRAARPIETARYKIGGDPVLLTAAELPRCKSCGEEMTFLAQIPLYSPVNVSDAYKMAYIFVCRSGNPDCQPWDPFAGANVVLLQNGEGNLLTAPAHPSEIPEFGADWTLAREPLLVGDEFDNADQEVIDQLHEKTKVGGSAAWLQGDDTPDCPNCGKQMRLVAQIDAVVDRGGEANPDSYYSLGFGDGGLSYLFICPDSCAPQSAAFLWQTT